MTNEERYCLIKSAEFYQFLCQFVSSAHAESQNSDIPEGKAKVCFAPPGYRLSSHLPLRPLSLCGYMIECVMHSRHDAKPTLVTRCNNT